MTNTEREADAQAALSRLANHRSQPGDYHKIPCEESGLVAELPTVCNCTQDGLPYCGRPKCDIDWCWYCGDEYTEPCPRHEGCCSDCEWENEEVVHRPMCARWVTGEITEVADRIASGHAICGATWRDTEATGWLWYCSLDVGHDGRHRCIGATW
jgi:hypothetical protein